MKRLSLILCVLLAGCTVGPRYAPPKVASAPAFPPEPADVASPLTAGAVDPAWWNGFHDPELSSLVTRLVRQNLDLQAAAERVEQARAEKRIARSAALPHVDGNATYDRTKQSATGFLALVQPAPGAPLVYNFFTDGLYASWDLDLFGRVRREVEAAEANRQELVEARRGLLLAAAADLAQDYVQLRGAQAQEALVRASLQLADRNLSLVRQQFSNGVATDADVALAEGQRATLAALLPPVETQKAALINAVGFLLAMEPRALEVELRAPGPQLAPPPVVPVGLPGQLVRRRPDVREAEAALHAATAETGVAVASFYPDFTLSGFAGFQSLFPQGLAGGASRAYNIGPTLSLPFFEGGQLRGNLQLRQAAQREAGLRFQRTVLGAQREADDAMTAYVQIQKQRAETAEAVRQDERALASARQSFEEGAADQRTVLTAEAALIGNRQSLTAVDTELRTSLVALYRVLGGGWETLEAIR